MNHNISPASCVHVTHFFSNFFLTCMKSVSWLRCCQTSIPRVTSSRLTTFCASGGFPLSGWFTNCLALMTFKGVLCFSWERNHTIDLSNFIPGYFLCAMHLIYNFICYTMYVFFGRQMSLISKNEMCTYNTLLVTWSSQNFKYLVDIMVSLCASFSNAAQLRLLYPLSLGIDSWEVLGPSLYIFQSLQSLLSCASWTGDSLFRLHILKSKCL